MMNISIKKLWSEYGIGGIFILLIVLYGLYLLYNNISNKGLIGNETMSQSRNPVYGNSPSPAQESGNEQYSSVNSRGEINGTSSIQNPADLLPRDTNSNWAQLNPAGQGDLANINLLKAGYHIGIDTIGQSLRNANLQLRSEPPNPQTSAGPWNQSTITPDLMRVPLELGSGPQ